jgi:UDP-N-acetylglucosamine 4,6-dehydratase (inverting)
MNNQQILITGGTGSFGNAFVRYIFTHYPQVKRVVIFSRDEQKQFEMAQEFSPKKYPIKYVLGDVRNLDSLLKATRNIDILVHSAAMKHVPAAEQNPMECVMTNILGSQNVIDAAFANNVKKVVALSTDKSTYPINVYGASKLFLEKLFTYADTQKGDQDIRFSVVRYGNVFGSKGSVIPFFLKRRHDDFLPITHADMTRFSITMQEGIELVMYALTKAWGGEVIVPIAPSYRILDVAAAIAPDIEHRIVGIRPGEKLDEIMITSNESSCTVQRDHYYIVCPHEGHWSRDEYCAKTDAAKVADGFEYDSANNKDWLDVASIKKLITTESILS